MSFGAAGNGITDDSQVLCIKQYNFNSVIASKVSTYIVSVFFCLFELIIKALASNDWTKYLRFYRLVLRTEALIWCEL